VADLQNPPLEIPLHLRPLLQEEGDIEGALRVLPPREVGRRQPDSQVEEIGVRAALLPAVHKQNGQQLGERVHLQGSQGQPGGGQAGGMREMRVQGLRFRRLNYYSNKVNQLQSATSGIFNVGKERWRFLVR